MNNKKPRRTELVQRGFLAISLQRLLFGRYEVFCFSKGNHLRGLLKTPQKPKFQGYIIRT